MCVLSIRTMHSLALEVEYPDAAVRSSAQPITIRRERKCVHDITSGEGVEVLALVQVPEHGATVTTTRSCKRAIWRNSECKDGALMALVVCTELALREFPDLVR